jgi:hypothetical protein
MNDQYLHVVVTTTLPEDQLHEEDACLPDVYLVEVPAGIPTHLAAWAALEAFHQKTGIEELDDFEVEVFDPATGKYWHQAEDEPSYDERKRLRYAFCGKIEDAHPNSYDRPCFSPE